MHILCERSNAGNDVRCDMCGQGFVVHWTRITPAQRAQARQLVLRTLRRQHADEPSGHHVHPDAQFAVASESADVPALASAAA